MNGFERQPKIGFSYLSSIVLPTISKQCKKANTILENLFTVHWFY